MPAATRFLAGLAVAGCLVLLGPHAPRLDAQTGGVQWTNLVHVKVSGDVLQKTSGCNGCDDAGATSQEELSAGDGYVEFTVGEMNTLWLAGLSHGNGGTAYGDIDFAFFFNGSGSAEIREAGAYRADTAYAAGDTFRVGVADGRVQYSKNGALIRESANTPQYPLLLDTSLLTRGATVHGAVLSATAPPAGDGETGAGALDDGFWTDRANVVVAGGAVLQKSSGCDGCDDAGAVSSQALSAGDGYVEFAVGEMNTLWFAGLSHGNSGTTYGDIDFAFFFNGGGYADIRENGAYKADTLYAVGDVFRVGVFSGRVQYFKNGTLLRESATTPEYPLLLDTSLLTIGATVPGAVLAATDPLPEGQGLLEKSGSPALRARFTRTEIESFLPPDDARGAFVFPSPYDTAAVRLTNADDCVSGQDCIRSVGYSYWRNSNNHVGSSDMYIFLGTNQPRGRGGPTLIRYTKATDVVQRLGPLFSPGTAHSYSTGEGWYFSGTHPTRLYTFLVGSPELRRYDILARQFEPTAAMDLRGCARPLVCPADAASIVQPHSSDDDQVHSATVQDTNWQRIGCVVYDSAADQFRYYAPPDGHRLDECHVDKAGGWLLLNEAAADGTRHNRIVDLASGAVTSVDVFNGALGHMDMGHGYGIGADTYSPMPNATILMDFPLTSTVRPIGSVVHYNKRWDIVAANHVSHGNAIDAEPESQYACGSNASRVADMADEIVCFPLDASRNVDGSLDVLVVGQVLTDLDAAGGQDQNGDDYEQLPKGNLDITGRYFIWSTNMGGDRLDVFLVKIPAERLMDPAGSN